MKSRVDQIKGVIGKTVMFFLSTMIMGGMRGVAIGDTGVPPKIKLVYVFATHQ